MQLAQEAGFCDRASSAGVHDGARHTEWHLQVYSFAFHYCSWLQSDGRAARFAHSVRQGAQDEEAHFPARFAKAACKLQEQYGLRSLSSCCRQLPATFQTGRQHQLLFGLVARDEPLASWASFMAWTCIQSRKVLPRPLKRRQPTTLEFGRGCSVQRSAVLLPSRSCRRCSGNRQQHLVATLHSCSDATPNARTPQATPIGKRSSNHTC